MAESPHYKELLQLLNGFGNTDLGILRSPQPRDGSSVRSVCPDTLILLSRARRRRFISSRLRLRYLN